MIIPRHKVCDFCEEPVGVNKRYFKIKSKAYYVGYAGSCSDNRTHHICEDCMHEITKHIHDKLKKEAAQKSLEKYIQYIKEANDEKDVEKKLILFEKANAAYKKYEEYNRQYDSLDKKITRSLGLDHKEDNK